MKPHMGYQVVLETDPETGHITGTVLGLPEIVVDGMTEQGVLDDLRIAIGMALTDPGVSARAEAVVRVVTLDA